MNKINTHAFEIKKLLIVSVLFLLKTSSLFSQNITGTWEGIMADEFLRISIIQEGKDLCGYTSDVVINDRSSKCKVYFKGLYNKKNKTWIITGISFIENAGNHVLMTLKLWESGTGNANVLRGAVTTQLFMEEPRNIFYNDFFTVRKVSNEPLELSGNRPTCLEMPKKQKTPFVKTPERKDTDKNEKKKKNPEKSPETNSDDTNKKPEDVITPPVVKENTPKNDEELTNKMKERKKNEISRLDISEPEIELSVYDNGIVDNDTVSIFYNGRLIKSKQRLSEEPLKIKLKLDENTRQHEITMFAENLGSIPPNTAIIIINAGSKRYELRSSASLEENAVLYLEYKP